MRSFPVWMMVCVLTLPALEATAQETPSDEVSPSETELEADKAMDAGEYERALKLYERAYLETGDAYNIYRRILVYEKLEKTDVALELLEQNRSALESNTRISDLALVEQRIKATDTSSSTDTSGPNGVWQLASGGGLLVLGGTSLLLAVRQGRRLQCTSGATSLETRSHCDGSANAEQPDPETWDRQWRNVRIGEAAGWTGLGLGVGLIGWGLFTRTTRASNDSVTLRPPSVNFTRERATLTISFDF